MEQPDSGTGSLERTNVSISKLPGCRRSPGEVDGDLFPLMTEATVGDHCLEGGGEMEWSGPGVGPQAVTERSG